MGIINKLLAIKELPVLPEVMFKVREIIESDDSGAQELAKIIERDPAISSTILKAANSAYYNSSRRQITAVRDAITRIGFNEVMRITMALGVIKQFTNSKSNINYRGFWKHSMAAASLSTVIADMSTNRNILVIREFLYLSGLLHDIGILVLDQFFHEEFAFLMNSSIEGRESFLNVESRIIESETHPFVGGTLLEIWKLASPVLSAVRYHHNPDRAPELHKLLAAIVALSEFVLCEVKQSNSFEGIAKQLSSEAWELMAIKGEMKEVVAHLHKKALDELEKSDLILSSASGALLHLREEKKTVFTFGTI